MLRTIVLLLFLAAQTIARPIGNGDINQLRFKHEHKPRYQKSAKSKKLPKKFLKMEYEKPQLKDWLLPYTRWAQKDRAHFKKLIGETRLDFTPSLIVMHYTVTPSAESTYRVLSRKQVGVQLMVGHDGTVYRLMPLERRATGAYGVNHVALSIEMVAQTESDLLSRTKQVFSSFCLVKYLCAEFDIPVKKVVAHYEVSEGKRVVSEYTDNHDKIFPDRYPPSSRRLDPGPTYMSWLRQYLKKEPPQASDAE